MTGDSFGIAQMDVVFSFHFDHFVMLENNAMHVGQQRRVAAWEKVLKNCQLLKTRRTKI